MQQYNPYKYQPNATEWIKEFDYAKYNCKDKSKVRMRYLCTYNLFDLCVNVLCMHFILCTHFCFWTHQNNFERVLNIEESVLLLFIFIEFNEVRTSILIEKQSTLLKTSLSNSQ